MRERGMLTPEDGRSQIAEEMRAIKRPLIKKAFSVDVSAENHHNLIMVTSSVPGEGKSYSSINLAVSIAMELDRTALLVDADVAKPSIAQYLGFRAKKGLVDYLMEERISLSDIMIKTDLPKLSILPAGRQYHYSTELLASENMLTLLDELSRRYHDRIIIFDSPPILATSEAEVLANQVGQVVVVVEAVKTSQHVLQEAMAKIPNANISGLILNKSRVKGGGSSYGYGYG
ncbi:MAG TPA: polysaccharide biosynthesis tyrosine autokinase, partial [Gammaproteobacteria bacterium]|nr:polysaccharide biosynthesis tyrosine autokinase [Gammaproteobacteria bacterium]